jgi:hypothetical protein
MQRWLCPRSLVRWESTLPIHRSWTLGGAVGKRPLLAPLTAPNLEPLDGRGVYVDMNGNGVRDKRESLTQAWQRLGLLKSGQQMTSAVYQNCVKNAAAKLVKQGLLPAKLGEYYLDKASRTRLLN